MEVASLGSPVIRVFSGSRCRLCVTGRCVRYCCVNSMGVAWSLMLIRSRQKTARAVLLVRAGLALDRTSCCLLLLTSSSGSKEMCIAPQKEQRCERWNSCVVVYSWYPHWGKVEGVHSRTGSEEVGAWLGRLLVDLTGGYPNKRRIIVYGSRFCVHGRLVGMS